MKLQLIAAAAMFAVAGQASASIANGGTGNGELFLSVYDPVALVSYTRDLGVDMNAFIANGNTTNRNFSADALLTSTFNLSASGLLWNVAALDSVGATLVGQRYLSTTNATLATVQSNGNTKVGNFSVVNDYVNGVNGTDTVSATNNSSVHTSADGLSYFGNGFQNNWHTQANFDSTAAVGQSLGFFLITPSSNSGLSKATGSSQFAGTAGNATWNLAADGSLSYTVASAPAPAPAPVPVPAALWLLGSGLIGMVGVARRKAA